MAPVRSYRGGSSVARHPRPGYSFSGYGRSSRYGRGLSGYYRSYGPRYYGGNYRPYRGYSLGRLAYSWWPSLSFSYYDSPYYDSPYYDYPTSPGYVIDESAGAPGPDDDAGYDDGGSAYDTPSYADTGRLLLVITPSDAAVYMDDDYWGNGRDARSITLRSGSHTIEIVRPGFLPVRRSLVVVRGQTSEFRVDLPRP